MHNLVQQALQELSSSPLEAPELQEGEQCLLEFFKLLIETDQEQKQKEAKNE